MRWGAWIEVGGKGGGRAHRCVLEQFSCLLHLNQFVLRLCGSSGYNT